MDKPKGRKLLKIHFDFENPHLAYTSPDLPACSLRDEAVMFKSIKPLTGVTKVQESLLEKLGKTISKSTDNPSESLESLPSSVEAPEDNNSKIVKSKGTEQKMSNAPTEKEETLQKQLDLMKASLLESELSKFSYSEAEMKEVLPALMQIDDAKPIFKAMSSLAVKLEKSIKNNLSVENGPNLDSEVGVGLSEEEINKSKESGEDNTTGDILKHLKSIQGTGE